MNLTPEESARLLADYPPPPGVVPRFRWGVWGFGEDRQHVRHGRPYTGQPLVWVYSIASGCSELPNGWPVEEEAAEVAAREWECGEMLRIYQPPSLRARRFPWQW